MIIAIDPGSKESAIVFVDNYVPIYKAKLKNEELELFYDTIGGASSVVIENISSYGMPVGREVFDTAMWIGRYVEMFSRKGIKVSLLDRQKVKNYLIPRRGVKDKDVIEYLVKRFAPNTPNKGKGVKGNKGFFYGFKADIWQAYALGVAYLDLGRIK